MQVAGSFSNLANLNTSPLSGFAARDQTGREGEPEQGGLLGQRLRQQRVTRTASAPRQRAATIESTLIVLVLASSVPVTLTRCPANFSGVR